MKCESVSKNMNLNWDFGAYVRVRIAMAVCRTFSAASAPTNQPQTQTHTASAPNEMPGQVSQTLIFHCVRIEISFRRLNFDNFTLFSFCLLFYYRRFVSACRSKFFFSTQQTMESNSKPTRNYMNIFSGSFCSVDGVIITRCVEGK